MLKMRKFSGVFTYECPETGFRISKRNFPALIQKVVDYRKAHNLQVPVGFADMVEHNWCVQNPKYCQDEESVAEPEKAKPKPAKPAQITSYPPLSTQVRSFVKEWKEFSNSGFKVSDRPLIESRLNTCVNCEFWNGAKSFMKFRCKMCGCCMRIKVGMKSARCPAGKW